MKRLKVLISAYACSPYRGSEPGVGWGFVSALAKHHDLWVIVEEEKFRADIERYLADNPTFGGSVQFCFLKKRRNRLLRKLWPPSYYWHYRQWHREALTLAEKLHAEIGFDLVHQLTMVGYREPGYLWKMRLPFVWGPIGGMGLFPWRFLGTLGAYGGIYYMGYNIFNFMQMRLLSRPRLAAEFAATGLVFATEENRLSALRHWGSEGRVLCEVGLPHTPAIVPRPRSAGEAFRIVWSGEHIPRKALSIGLRALALLPEELTWEFHILGGGPLESAWRLMARNIGLSGRCNFYGRVPRETALKVMKSAHALLITSLRDLTSTVTVEALATGLPIICPDHCGFADVVTKDCGIRVPVTTPSGLAAGLAAALSQLIRDDAVRTHLAKGSLRRAHDFAWDEKAEQMSAIYHARLCETARRARP
jgi:glycosyltransferase involved in cell wall biosynthesis